MQLYDHCIFIYSCGLRKRWYWYQDAVFRLSSSSCKVKEWVYRQRVKQKWSLLRERQTLSQPGRYPSGLQESTLSFFRIYIPCWILIGSPVEAVCLGEKVLCLLVLPWPIPPAILAQVGFHPAAQSCCLSS